MSTDEITIQRIGIIEWGRERGHYVVTADFSVMSEGLCGVVVRCITDRLENYMASKPRWEENKIPLDRVQPIFLKLDDRTLFWGEFRAVLLEELDVAWKVKQEGTGIGAWSAKRLIICLKSEVEELHAEALTVLQHEREVLHPLYDQLKTLINRG